MVRKMLPAESTGFSILLIAGGEMYAINQFIDCCESKNTNDRP
jgi:hypothetical protein